ncbi:MAG: hypothetical protein IJ349_00745 [Clostridia bacterium]|nr:hypothetical protein [Clostridia bacterium]
MIRLFILDDISPSASDAVYKIGLAAEEFGLSDDTIQIFPTRDSLYDEALLATEKGDYVIVGCECVDYNHCKRELMAKLLLEEYESDEIKDLITINAGDDISEIDLMGHSLVARGSIYHFTTDGLFCGFTTDVLHGKLTYLPLDFLRIDAVLVSLVEDVLEPMDAIAKGERPPIRMPQTDILPHVEKIVSCLSTTDQKLALATSEATMWVYNLYDQVPELTERVSFVEVVDDEAAGAETTAETESVKIIRHAREAMLNSESTMGGAISEVYSTENEEGKTVYFAYAAVVDKGTAKAKKINTSNPEDLAAILPHALAVLSGLVEAKTDKIIKTLEAAQKKQEAEEAAAAASDPVEEKKLSKNMIIFAACALAVAIILPILLVMGMTKDKTPTTVQPVVNPSISTTANNPTQPTSNPFGGNSQQTTLQGIVNAGVTEPSSPDVSATPTAAPVASTSGTFTFYVFGYGHGVGMSQVGANYLAGLGWSWADILAHYYYDPNTYIVTGETYPQKITYEGTQYDTREYLARALEAEMPASSNHEALKAQVVAIYTFARYYNPNSIATANPIFTENLTKSSHAFLEASKTPASSIYAAVDEIIQIGAYISNNGATALTPFHAMSAGVTTSYYNCWGKDSGTSVPYLSGARSSIGDYYDEDFKSTVTISSAELQSLAAAQGITLSGDPASWINIISHDAAVREDIGYVSSIKVGGQVMTGNDFRIKLLGGKIRSHCFAMTYTPSV